MPPTRITNPNLNISHNQIESLDISRLVAGQLAAKEYRTKMKIDGCTYDVRLKMDDGSVTVKREIGFLRGLFTKNYATSLRNKVQSQIEALHTRRYWAGLNRASKEGNLIALARHFKNNPVEKQDVASYGFECVGPETVHPRKNAATALGIHSAHNPGHTLSEKKIDHYNQAVGITFTSRLLTLPALLTQIRTGQLPIHSTAAELERSKVKEWKAMLQQQIERVDIFAHISKFITEGRMPATASTKQSGWAHQVRTAGEDLTMQAYVRKNLPPSGTIPGLTEAHISQVASTLKELALTRPSAKMDDAFMNRFLQSHLGGVPGLFSGPAATAFKCVTQIAFLRQTSKVGLEFFRDQSVPVVFQCYSHKGMNLIEKPAAGQGNPAQPIRLTDEVTNKWWYNPAIRSNLNLYQPITYSEMRHLNRLQNAGSAPQVIAVRIEN